MVYTEMWAVPAGGHWVPREVVKTLSRLQQQYKITVVVDEAFTAFRCGALNAQHPRLYFLPHRSYVVRGVRVAASE
jgi:histidinol-phosphate/aromatic aminotransferase/cobyric acid decarboxylase-like protein